MSPELFHFLKKVRKACLFLQSYFKFPFIAKDYFNFKRLSQDDRFTASFSNIMPCLFENIPYTRFDTHYVYHTAWAARKVKEIGAKEHVDISSSLYFSSIVSAFVPVRFYDFRPAKLNLSNLTSLSANLLHLPFEENSVESLSCMHTVEHVGLGRYGDTLDPDGDIKAARELSHVLKKGGSLLFVVPVGKQRVAFNAHRIYAYQTVIDLFPELTLKEFSLIPDDALTVGMMYGAKVEDVVSQNYGCGCFWFVKE